MLIFMSCLLTSWPLFAQTIIFTKYDLNLLADYAKSCGKPLEKKNLETLKKKFLSEKKIKIDKVICGLESSTDDTPMLTIMTKENGQSGSRSDYYVHFRQTEGAYTVEKISEGILEYTKTRDGRGSFRSQGTATVIWPPAVRATGEGAGSAQK